MTIRLSKRDIHIANILDLKMLAENRKFSNYFYVYLVPLANISYRFYSMTLYVIQCNGKYIQLSHFLFCYILITFTYWILPNVKENLYHIIIIIQWSTWRRLGTLFTLISSEYLCSPKSILYSTTNTEFLMATNWWWESFTFNCRLFSVRKIHHNLINKLSV